jgi:hypothetical protein
MRDMRSVQVADCCVAALLEVCELVREVWNAQPSIHLGRPSFPASSWVHQYSPLFLAQLTSSGAVYSLSTLLWVELIVNPGFACLSIWYGIREHVNTATEPAERTQLHCGISRHNQARGLLATFIFKDLSFGH